MDALALIGELTEVKQNYNPNQPREPRGSPAGGRWAIVPNGSWQVMDTSGVNRATRVAAAKVDAFLLKHRKAITRLLGALQVLDGLGEAAAGVRLGGVGVATSHVGVGVLAAGLAGWMVKHGYDNVEAGILALATGHPQETNLFKSVRDLGLSEAATGRLELALSGGGVLGGGLIARRALPDPPGLARTFPRDVGARLGAGAGAVLYGLGDFRGACPDRDPLHQGGAVAAHGGHRRLCRRDGRSDDVEDC